jgi:Na+/H+-translocating membrane pyrophosphatase
LSSAKGLFLLEALAAAAVVSITALLVSAAVCVQWHGYEDMKEISQQLDEAYASYLEGESTCVITCPSEAAATP